MKVNIEDTYAEAFDGLYSRVVITADNERMLRRAGKDATAMPAVVIGRIEGGIEKWLEKNETPDGRKGVLVQFWGNFEEKKVPDQGVKKFEVEMSYIIRQCILVKPFTAVFDAFLNPLGKIDVMERIGHCGDRFEWESKLYGRNIVTVPIMVPDFRIERHLGYGVGVMGGNFWYMCRTKEALMKAGNKALKAIHEVEGVVTPFDVCSAGSKTETEYPIIGPTTNHPYCPSLKKKLGIESKVPEGVKYIPEIVINGRSLDHVKAAMKAGIDAASSIEGVVKISAGNYGGRLGKHRINLRELLP
jgi:formylmethanofuran--tetrahydromethanopterin N-formyltransferase